MRNKFEPFSAWLAMILKPAFVIIYIGLILLSYCYLDRPIAIYFHDLHLGITFPVLYWMTNLAQPVLVLILITILAIFYRLSTNKKMEMRVWFLWCCVLIPSMGTYILKLLFGRARPVLFFKQNLFGFYGPHFTVEYFSCPSGHVTAITGLMIGMVILFPKYIYAIIPGAILFISTRVLLDLHYLSDVLFTVYLVFLELGLVFYLIRNSQSGLIPR